MASVASEFKIESRRNVMISLGAESLPLNWPAITLCGRSRKVPVVRDAHLLPFALLPIRASERRIRIHRISCRGECHIEAAGGEIDKGTTC